MRNQLKNLSIEPVCTLVLLEFLISNDIERMVSFTNLQSEWFYKKIYFPPYALGRTKRLAIPTMKLLKNEVNAIYNYLNWPRKCLSVQE